MTRNLSIIHSFSSEILEILKSDFGDNGDYIFENSPIIGYLNTKTKSAGKGSKARGAFANHYALYVVIEDYIKKGYADENSKDYSDYEGAISKQRKQVYNAQDKLNRIAIIASGSDWTTFNECRTNNDGY